MHDDAEKPQLSLILARNQQSPRREFALWACRGEGKGCARNRYRTSKAPCDDCFGPLPEGMTIAEVLKRVEQGDA